MRLGNRFTSTTVLFLALMLARPTAHADELIRKADLDRFAGLSRIVVRDPITETPTKPMSEALDLLLDASVAICRQAPAITSEQLMKRMEPFKRRLDPDKKAIGEMDPGWFDLAVARRGSRRAIAVTMGAVSRLRIIDVVNGDKIQVAGPMQWLYRCHQRPQFASDGSLVVISDSVQDAGIRVGLRIDLMRQIGMTYTVVQTLKRLFVLDTEYPALSGDRLTVRSVDTPAAILTSQADHHFGRVEEFAVTTSGFRPVRTQLLDPELRAIDAWLLAARQSKSPNSQQSLARKRIGEGELLSDCSIKSVGPDIVEATVEFDSAKFRFTLRRADGVLRVFSVKALS